MRLSQTQFALPGKKKNNRTKTRGAVQAAESPSDEKGRAISPVYAQAHSSQRLAARFMHSSQRLARVNLGPDLLTKQDEAPEPDLPTCAGQEG